MIEFQARVNILHNTCQKSLNARKAYFMAFLAFLSPGGLIDYAKYILKYENFRLDLEKFKGDL